MEKVEIVRVGEEAQSWDASSMFTTSPATISTLKTIRVTPISPYVENDFLVFMDFVTLSETEVNTMGLTQM